jgi:hypothetical protein
VSLHKGPAEQTAKPLSARQRVNRKIARFSVWIGAVAVVLAVIGWAVASYASFERSKRINIKALSEISCGDATCNTSAFIMNPHLDEPDYLIDLQSRYFIFVPSTSAEHPERFAWREYKRQISPSDVLNELGWRYCPMKVVSE